ncbi:MAG: hypothetical protein R3Y54_09535 [Eubacteriales bacterium]
MDKTLEEVCQVNNNFSEDTKFVDHHRAFTPTSFELLIEDLYALGYIDLSIVGKVRKLTEDGFEFYVCLQKSQPSEIYTEEKRVRLLKKIEKELCVYVEN